MARLDTISSATWQPGSLLTGAIPDQTTVIEITGLHSGWWLLGLVASCDIAWVYDFKILDSASALYQNMSQRMRPAAGNETFYLPSAVLLPANAKVRVTLIGGITVVGLQGSIYTQLGSIV